MRNSPAVWHATTNNKRKNGKWKMNTSRNLCSDVYYASIPRRFHLGKLRTGRNFEIFGRVGAAGVERRHVFRKKFGDAEVAGFDSFDDTPGEFVSAIIVVMRAVTFLER